jgi:hypothetical protein
MIGDSALWAATGPTRSLRARTPSLSGPKHGLLFCMTGPCRATRCRPSKNQPSREQRRGTTTPRSLARSEQLSTLIGRATICGPMTIGTIRSPETGMHKKTRRRRSSWSLNTLGSGDFLSYIEAASHRHGAKTSAIGVLCLPAGSSIRQPLSPSPPSGLTSLVRSRRQIACTAGSPPHRQQEP